MHPRRQATLRISETIVNGEAMDRLIGVLGGVLGVLGVALGAFGAHGLKARLAGLPEMAERLGWWETGARYHLIHAVVVVLCALLPAGSLARPSAWAFTTGIGLFSGTLYVMALGGPRWLGAVTPLGGLLLIGGWILLAITAFKTGR